MKYLFVRILERCNAHCGMCEYAGNTYGYRFPTLDWPQLLDSAQAQGVRCIRLTGGEPLIHPHIITLVGQAHARGIIVSIITNGFLLVKLLPALVDAGLRQVIVSIDSANAEQHDSLRGLQTLHARALAGVRSAKSMGVHVRVNTVCGPDNFRGMPALQELLTELCVDQWELSTLKLERPLDYEEGDLNALRDVTHIVYGQAPLAGKLRPMGKVWWGESSAENELYLRAGIAPRPIDRCLVVEHTRYLDPVSRRLFPCSLLPHRATPERYSVLADEWSRLPMSSKEMMAIVDQLSTTGFRHCTGCSSTAARFTPADEVLGGPFVWDY